MNTDINENEIELADVSKNVISFIKQASRHILLALTFGILTGLAVFYFTDPYYKSQLGFYSDNLSDSKLYSLMSDLQTFVNTEEYNTLAKKLNISEKSAKKISAMKVAAIEQFQETEKEENGIIVTFTVADNILFDSLEQGIKHYVENTEYVRTRLASSKQGLISNINSLTAEITDLQTLKQTLNYLIQKGGKSNLYLNDIGYTGSKIVELSEKKSSLETQLGMISDIRIFKNFSKYNKKAGPRLLDTLLIYIGIAELIGIFIFLFPKIKEFVAEA